MRKKNRPKLLLSKDAGGPPLVYTTNAPGGDPRVSSPPIARRGGAKGLRATEPVGWWARPGLAAPDSREPTGAAAGAPRRRNLAGDDGVGGAAAEVAAAVAAAATPGRVWVAPGRREERLKVSVSKPREDLPTNEEFCENGARAAGMGPGAGGGRSGSCGKVGWRQVSGRRRELRRRPGASRKEIDTRRDETRGQSPGTTQKL